MENYRPSKSLYEFDQRESEANSARKVKVVEVGPRDGLQNEKTILPTEDKFFYIQQLIEAGCQNIEVTSFVNPEKIPQMADAQALFSQVLKNSQKIHSAPLHFPCLVPNLQGLKKALEVGVKEIAIFSATSDTFNKKNINADREESFRRLLPVCQEAKKLGLNVRAYISTAFGCPYEGDIKDEILLDVAHRFQAMEVDEISLGDTIGVATPAKVYRTLKMMEKDFDFSRLAMHFHDTRGMALSNVLVSLELGINIFDSSSGGLGGCPYARGATGNLASEDLIYLLNSLHIETGIDLEKLCQASTNLLKKMGKTSTSKYLLYYQNNCLANK